MAPPPAGPEELAVDVTRVDQIAIAVEDLDQALAFYERAFGLRANSRERIEPDGVEEAMLEVGGVWIQLLQPTREDSPVARYLARHGPGLHHLGFGVRSVVDALDHLREQDVELIDQEPRTGGGGHTIGFVHPRGTGGVLVELVEDAYGSPGDDHGEDHGPSVRGGASTGTPDRPDTRAARGDAAAG